MKKIILALLTLGIMLSFTACEVDTESTPSSTNDQTTATSDDSSSTVENASEKSSNTYEGEGNIDDYHIKIVSASKDTDYQGKDAIVVTYQWTNNSDESQMFSTAFSDKAFQNGIECTSAYFVDGIDAQQPLTEIKPGATFEVKRAYELKDDSDVTIEVTPWISLGDDTMVTKTFSVK